MSILNGLKSRISGLGEAAANLLAKKSLYYVVEPADWVIKDVGRNITGRMQNLSSRITTVPKGIRGSIVHFGSINTYIECQRRSGMHASNKIIVTWFHIAEGDALPEMAERFDKTVRIWHTACIATRDKLVAAGIRESKIKVIPLGVDLAAFKPMAPDFRRRFRAHLAIPDDRVVIGSFQKDGVGWGEGIEPKLIKGPDIFCEAVENLARKVKVTVLLTGPARGYVKCRLEAAGIPFVHRLLSRPQDVADFYQALDVYIITSREEGGPMQILESMASGVPLISTSVGMAPDIIVNGENGFLVPKKGIGSIPALCLEILENAPLRERLVAKGLSTASRFGWESIAEMYYARLYQESSQGDADAIAPRF